MQNISAQILSIMGMIMNTLSWQNKKKQLVILFQFFGSAFFAVSFFMMKAYVGAFFNLIGVLRAIVYLDEEKFKANSPKWLYGFITLYVITYFITVIFFTEHKVINYIISFLPVVGMTVQNIAFCKKDAKSIRNLGFISSPAWLIYNINAGSIGAILCEVLTLISIIVGKIRIDWKKVPKFKNPAD